MILEMDPATRARVNLLIESALREVELRGPIGSTQDMACCTIVVLAHRLARITCLKDDMVDIALGAE